MTTPIREELEKAFSQEYTNRFGKPPSELLGGQMALDSALWAAKWMAERCAEELHGKTLQGSVICRQLANELGEKEGGV